MDIHPFKVLSLCSGGGGLEIGLGLAIGNARTVCYVENEAFAIASLEEAFEINGLDDAPIWSDVKTFDGKPWRNHVDCVTAGYPCQPFSTAGKRKGADDPRHLWPHIRRIIEEVGPGWVFLENVSGHLKLGFDVVRSELVELGFRVKAGLFTASEVGCNHERKRLFILAHSKSKGIVRESGNICKADGRQGNELSREFTGTGKLAHATKFAEREQDDKTGSITRENAWAGTCGSGERLANSVKPGRTGRDDSGKTGPRHDENAEILVARPGCELEDTGLAECGHELADTEIARKRGLPVGKETKDSGLAECGHELADNSFSGKRAISELQRQKDININRSNGIPLFPPGPDEEEPWDGIIREYPLIAPAVSRKYLYELAREKAREQVDSVSLCEPRRTRVFKKAVKSAFRGMAHVLADRPHKLSLLGNGVDPIQAAVAFISLWYEVTRSNVKGRKS